MNEVFPDPRVNKQPVGLTELQYHHTLLENRLITIENQIKDLRPVLFELKAMLITLIHREGQ
jgi:chaperonin cofactor prefoldin